jgi:hemoglobin-like flavoprotein
MAMSPEAVRLVRESWAQVESTRLELAHAFYRHLFRIAPATQRLFGNVPPAVQEEKFADMLNEIVRVIDRPYQLLPQVTLLGRRHMQYGVTAEDYAPVGDALLIALEERLGTAFTPRVRAAWNEAYQTLAHTMVRHAMRDIG